MSHFCVLVAVNDIKDLHDVLQPFHEFECTGEDDQYVIDKDVTNDYLNSYNNSKIDVYIRKNDQQYFDVHDPIFKREATDEEKSAINSISQSNNNFYWSRGTDKNGNMIFYISEANKDEYDLVNVNYSSMMSFNEFLNKESINVFSKKDQINDKNIYALGDDNGNAYKVIRRTNPNSKWDYWVLGGRFSDGLLLKDGSFADFAKKKDIDFDKMESDKRKKLIDSIDNIIYEVGEKTNKTKQEVLDMWVLYCQNY